VGSGHILVRAYDTLKDIYKSKGYSISQIPQLILENNLYGFDICPRAHQLACFAVLMKAKADDVSIHTKVDVTKHLICIIENNNFMEVDDKKYPHLRSFLQLRYNASMYGSLIRIPNDIDEAKIRKEFLQFQKERNLFADGICDNQTLELLFNQTNLLDGVYDCTVANPPYK
jgi:type II restriction/modification system DNA methylase subunit YeeA